MVNVNKNLLHVAKKLKEIKLRDSAYVSFLPMNLRRIYAKWELDCSTKKKNPNVDSKIVKFLLIMR